MDSRDRYAIEFLHSFVKSLAEKVERVEREYVDYVPTQVVTEFFPSTFRHGGATSGQRTGRKISYLVRRPEECCP